MSLTVFNFKYHQVQIFTTFKFLQFQIYQLQLSSPIILQFFKFNLHTSSFNFNFKFYHLQTMGFQLIFCFSFMFVSFTWMVCRGDFFFLPFSDLRENVLVNENNYLKMQTKTRLIGDLFSHISQKQISFCSWHISVQ